MLGILALLLISGCSINNNQIDYCKELGFDDKEWEVKSGYDDMDFYCVNSNARNNYEGSPNNETLFVTDNTYQLWKSCKKNQVVVNVNQRTQTKRGEKIKCLN